MNGDSDEVVMEEESFELVVALLVWVSPFVEVEVD